MVQKMKRMAETHVGVIKTALQNLRVVMLKQN